ncbi:hypothetical protein GCM10029992_29890 [Glycomyces albus]
MAKSRLPAVVATAVAVPVAAVVGVLVFNLIAPAADEDRFESGRDLAAVEVEVPTLSDEEAVVCLALTSSVPEEVAELPARPVEGGDHASEFVVAFGDPAVVATCGTDPVEVEDTEAVFGLNGVCWYSDENGDGERWVTLDREVPVGVEVPGDYQALDVLNGLSPTVAEKVPAAEDAPTGCS